MVQLSTVLAISRPRHWVKNFALFAPLFFSGNLFSFPHVTVVTLGVGAFCLLAASSYIFNDILDVEEDRHHPFKRERPIAKGAISMTGALTLALLFGTGGLIISFTINHLFGMLAGVFLLLHYINSLALRRIAGIDILALAAGHVLRVYAGVAATGVHISIWLALSVFSLSLFFAIGKRRSELTVLEVRGISRLQRKRLGPGYSEQMINTYTAIFATATFLSYIYYTFLLSPLPTGFLPHELIAGERKWMMITVPFVLYGIMRYLQIVYEGRGGTLEKLATTDKPLIVTAVGWVVTAFAVIYGIGG